jgi:hypothetical protein
MYAPTYTFNINTYTTEQQKQQMRHKSMLHMMSYAKHVACVAISFLRREIVLTLVVIVATALTDSLLHCAHTDTQIA